MKQLIRSFYIGKSPASIRFRYFLILFDFTTIIFFVATAHIPHGPGLIVASLMVGLIILLDFMARSGSHGIG